MQREERVLRDLCIEIAKGEIGGNRFNQLLIETGVYLDEHEWSVANKILGMSDRMESLVQAAISTQ